MSALDDLGVAVDAAVARMTSDKATEVSDAATIADLHNQLTAAQAAETDAVALAALTAKLSAATAA
jgi:hypothetical protein